MKMSEDSRYFMRLFLWVVFWIMVVFVLIAPIAFAQAPAQ